MKQISHRCIALALLLGVIGHSNAGLLYDNGALHPTNPELTITTASWAISDSFTLAGPSTLTGVQAGFAIEPLGAHPTAVHWQLGTTSFGSDIGSGSANPSNMLVGSTSLFTVYESTFPLNQTLAAGTYWLTLDAASSGGFVGWIESFGPSNAEQRSADMSVDRVIPSESFQVFGTSAVAPEPASALTLALGASAAAVYSWRRRRRAVTHGAKSVGAHS